MAIDAFLDFTQATTVTTPVKGESLDKTFKDTFHVKTFTFAVNQKGTAATGTGLGAGKAEFDDFEFTIDTQLGSSQLMEHCAMGSHFDVVVLHVRKAGGEHREFLQYRFGSCIVSSYSTSGDEESTDTVKFNYRQVATKYIGQKDDGTLSESRDPEKGGGSAKGGWDLKTNARWDQGINQLILNTDGK